MVGAQHPPYGALLPLRCEDGCEEGGCLPPTDFGLPPRIFAPRRMTEDRTFLLLCQVQSAGAALAARGRGGSSGFRPIGRGVDVGRVALSVEARHLGEVKGAGAYDAGDVDAEKIWSRSALRVVYTPHVLQRKCRAVPLLKR